MIDQSSQIEDRLTPLSVWLRGVGRSKATGWRWRRRGWLRVVNIGGRNYVPADEIGRFLQRADAGEFSRNNHPPLKNGNHLLK
ncbi:MAG: hypothetical protein KIS67_25125 [Verrucomicrobiae bacterium]|nr:hypothetical protein [Verrucomicrobiae bacterium]